MINKEISKEQILKSFEVIEKILTAPKEDLNLFWPILLAIFLNIPLIIILYFLFKIKSIRLIGTYDKEKDE